MKFRIIGVVFIFLIFFSCKNKIKNTVKCTKNDNNSSFRLENFTFSDTFKGKTLWKLFAKKAVVNNNTQIANLDNVKIVYNNKYIIMSDKGKYNINTKIAKLFNSVIIKCDNFTFFTNSLVFNSRIKKIYSKNKVKLMGDKILVKANSIVGFLNKKKFILKGNVYTELR